MKKIILFLFVHISILSYSQVSIDPGDGNGPPPPHTPPSEVGVTEGDLSVSLTGGANYNISLSLPPGINGVVPKIGLSYNSQSGNGIAGLGWNLTGLSAISRIQSTKFHNDNIDGVDFDYLDEFALDGERLILIPGRNPRYATEKFSNLRIKSYGIHPSGVDYGPEYFIVEYPDGSIANYGYTNGNTSNSRSILKWGITYWQNPQGVRIDYTYDIKDNTMYVSSIKYGSTGVNSHINEIVFVYKNRNRGEQGYVGEINVVDSQLISKIRIMGNGVGFRNYDLSYQILPSEYERLASITEKSGDNSKSYSPTVFDYYTTANTISMVNTSNLPSPVPQQPNTFEGYHNYLHGDFDINGKTDIIALSNNQRSNAIDYLYYSDLGYDINCLNTVSRINVGRYEGFFTTNFLVGTLTSGYKLKPNQGWCIVKTNPNTSVTNFSIFSDSNNPSNPVQSEYSVNYTFPKYCDNNGNAREANRQCLPGDYNGDGLTDVIIIDRGTTNYATETCSSNSYPTGTFTGKTYFVNLDKRLGSNNVNFSGNLPNISNTDLNGNTANTSYNPSNLFMLPVDSTVPNSHSDVISGDVNGDGKDEIVVVHYYGFQVYALNGYNELELIGTTQLNTYFDNWTSKPYIMDFNGDNKGDLVLRGSIYLSKGTTFIDSNSSIAGGTNLSSTGIAGFPTDFNNDGKPDSIVLDRSDNVLKVIAKINRKNLSWISNYYGDYLLSTTFSQPSNSGIVNVPFFVSKRKGYNEYCFMRGGIYINYYKISNDVSKDKLLKSVTLGNGVKETITYSTLTNGNGVYIASNTIENYPNMDIPNSIGQHVVSKIEKTSHDTYKKKLFKYHGAVANVEGLGFLGFRAILKTNWFDDNIEPISTITKYDISRRGAEVESFSVLGLVEPTHSLLPNSPFISKSLITYNHEDTTYVDPLLVTKVYKLFPTKVESFSGLDGTSSVINTQYNQYSNPTQTISSIRNGMTIEKTTTSNFNYSLAGLTTNPYMIDRPLSTTTSITIFPSNDTTTSEESYTYNGALLMQSKKRGHNTDYIIEDNLYDTYGNITKKTLSSIGAVNRITQFEYDPTTHRFLTKKIDIEGLITLNEYDQNTGLLLSKTLPSNANFPLTTSYEYDIWGKKTKIADYLGNHIIYTYANTTEKGVMITAVSDDGNSSKIYLDDLGREIKKGTKDLNNNWSFTSTTYNFNNNVIQTTEPYFESTGPTVWNEIIYDEYGRVTNANSQVSYISGGKQVSFEYVGLITKENDGQKVKQSTKNAMGSVILLSESPGETINYSYYANGNLKSIDCSGAVTIISQDGWGRKSQMVDPSAGTYIYVYNKFGEILSEEVVGKGITEYDRDDYGKITFKRIKENNILKAKNSYTYDPTTKLLTDLRYDDYTNNFFTLYKFTYDEYLRIIGTNEMIEQRAMFEKYIGYDNFGRSAYNYYASTNIADGSYAGTSFSITYKNGHQWQIIDDSAGTILWETNTVNANGQLLTGEMGNGVNINQTYDLYGFPIQFNHSKNNTSLMNLEMEFDNVYGNLIRRKNNMFGSWDEYLTYDSNDRVTHYKDNFGIQQQSYNDNGTIAQNNIGTHAYTISNKPYQVSTITPPNPSTSLTYYTGREQNVVYNLFKSPVSITEENNENIDFEYNAFNGRSAMYYGGLQSSKTQRPYRKYYSSDGTMEIKTKLSSPTSVEFTIYVGGDGYTAPLILRSDGTSQNFYYLHRDYQGTINVITDESGDVIEKRMFDVWGSLINYTKGSNTTIPTTSTTMFLDRGYTGHEHLLGVGLINMNGRIYDPKLHRFLQPDNNIQDPFNSQNYNRYAYVMNNPTKYTDPSGEFWQIIIGAIFSAYAGGVQASNGQLNPFNWNSTGWTNAALGAGSFGASSVATNFTNRYINDYNNPPSLPNNDLNNEGQHTVTSKEIHTFFSEIGDNFIRGATDRTIELITFVTVESHSSLYWATTLRDFGSNFINGRTMLNPSPEFIRDVGQGISNKSINDWAYAAGYNTPEIAASFIVPFAAEGAFARVTVSGGSRVFWSGEGAMNNAMQFAKFSGGKTLEMTMRGRIMNTLNPILPRYISNPIWRNLSTNFAKGATGEAHFFTSPVGPRPGSIWLNIEKPILQQNGVQIINH